MLTLSIFAVLLVLIIIDLPIVVAIALTAVCSSSPWAGNFLAMLPQRLYSGTTLRIARRAFSSYSPANLMNPAASRPAFSASPRPFRPRPGRAGPRSGRQLDDLLGDVGIGRGRTPRGLGQIRISHGRQTVTNPAISASIVAPRPRPSAPSYRVDPFRPLRRPHGRLGGPPLHGRLLSPRSHGHRG